eukprot:Skav234467  [mRNA]  locus=scaffold1647:259705:265279:+ [translate_table: standard]
MTSSAKLLVELWTLEILTADTAVRNLAAQESDSLRSRCHFLCLEPRGWWPPPRNLASTCNQSPRLKVWDKDFVRTTQGSDDFLGRLRLPMAHLLQHEKAELNQPLEDRPTGERLCSPRASPNVLQDTSKGELHVKAWLDVASVPSVQGGGYPLPSVVWEFEVRTGFETFDPASQKLIEDLYHASLAGERGASKVKIKSGNVEVFSEEELRHVKGIHRPRPCGKSGMTTLQMNLWTAEQWEALQCRGKAFHSAERRVFKVDLRRSLAIWRQYWHHSLEAKHLVHDPANRSAELCIDGQTHGRHGSVHVELQPGAVLWLPRGIVHQTSRCGKGISNHWSFAASLPQLSAGHVLTEVAEASGKVEVQQKLLDVLAKDNELSARLRQGHPSIEAVMAMLDEVVPGAWPALDRRNDSEARCFHKPTDITVPRRPLRKIRHSTANRPAKSGSLKSYTALASASTAFQLWRSDKGRVAIDKGRGKEPAHHCKVRHALEPRNFCNADSSKIAPGTARISKVARSALPSGKAVLKQ